VSAGIVFLSAIARSSLQTRDFYVVLAWSVSVSCPDPFIYRALFFWSTSLDWMEGEAQLTEQTALQQILNSAWFYILCKAPSHFLTAVNNLLAIASVFYIKPFFVNSAI